MVVVRCSWVGPNPRRCLHVRCMQPPKDYTPTGSTHFPLIISNNWLLSNRTQNPSVCTFFYQWFIFFLKLFFVSYILLSYPQCWSMQYKTNGLHKITTYMIAKISTCKLHVWPFPFFVLLGIIFLPKRGRNKKKPFRYDTVRMVD